MHKKAEESSIKVKQLEKSHQEAELTRHDALTTLLTANKDRLEATL